MAAPQSEPPTLQNGSQLPVAPTPTQPSPATQSFAPAHSPPVAIEPAGVQAGNGGLFPTEKNSQLSPGSHPACRLSDCCGDRTLQCGKHAEPGMPPSASFSNSLQDHLSRQEAVEPQTLWHRDAKHTCPVWQSVWAMQVVDGEAAPSGAPLAAASPASPPSTCAAPSWLGTSQKPISWVPSLKAGVMPLHVAWAPARATQSLEPTLQ